MNPIVQLEKKATTLSVHPQAKVHEARILIKALRAGLEYNRKRLKNYPKYERELKKCSDTLSPFRSVEARQELVEWLKKKRIIHVSSDFKKKSIAESPVPCVHEAKKECLEVVHTLQECGRHGAPDYKRINKAYQKFKKNPTPKNLHGMRKKIKRTAYQMQYFSKANGKNKKIGQILKKIGIQLGLARDLQVLIVDLKKQKNHRADLRILNKEKDQLTKKAIRKLHKLEKLAH